MLNHISVFIRKEVSGSILIPFLLLVVIMVQTGCKQAEEPGTTYKVYFLGGQSNMEGFGFTSQLQDTSLLFPDVMIFTGQPALDNDSSGGKGMWQMLQPGFGTGYRSDGSVNTLSDRFGPELFLGKTLNEQSEGAHIALIKYTLGGSGLTQGVGYGNWHPDFSENQGINQYDHALSTLQNALYVHDINGDGKADRLIPSGIVWMQGEADAFDSQAAADAYRTNIERLMDLFRAALHTDDLPVVVGKVTDSGMADDGSVMDYIETVQQAQQNFVRDDECAAFVTVTDSLGYLDDGWHYNTEGFIRMGTAFADAMMALENKCGNQTGAADY